MACWKPVLNWLRRPGLDGQRTALPKTFWSSPPTPVALESSRFSLNGVSKVREYATRSTVPVPLML